MDGRKDRAQSWEMTLLQPPWESSAPHPSASLPPLPHQTTPNFLPSLPSPCRAECGPSAGCEGPCWAAGSPQCCWGCVGAVWRHRKERGLEYFTCEASVAHKVILWIGHPPRAQRPRLPKPGRAVQRGQALLRPPRRDVLLPEARGSLVS